jgi:hypothetical protein
MSRLTDAVARKISGRGFHPDGGGLYLALRTQKDGAPSRSWVCRYTAPDGRRREVGLGRYPDVSLARARALAAELREAARKGTDPLAERDASRARAAFEAARRPAWRRRHVHDGDSLGGGAICDRGGLKRAGWARA